MARVIRKVYTPMAAASAAVCASQTPVAGQMLINGTLAASILWMVNGVNTLKSIASTTGTYKPNKDTVSPLGQKVTITVAADESAKTFVITGIDWMGTTITETVTGPVSGTATSVQSFYRVVSVSISANAAGAITVGFSGALDCPWIPVDRYVPTGQFSFYVVPSGTCTFKVDSTLENPQDPTVPMVVNSNILASGSTAGGQANLAQVMSAMRVTVTAYTSGSITLTMNYLTNN